MSFAEAQPDDPMYQAHLHVATLRSRGWTLRSIAAHANTSPTDVLRLGRSANWPNYSAAIGILNIDPNTRATKTTGTYREPNVSRVGTVRRIQALLAIGWSHTEITRRLNAMGIVDRRASTNLLHAPGSLVRRSRHDAVAAVYRDLLTIGNGPSAKARRYAEHFGYVPPGRWDDIDNDLEPEKPPELCSVDDCMRTAVWTFESSTHGAHERKPPKPRPARGLPASRGELA